MASVWYDADVGYKLAELLVQPPGCIVSLDRAVDVAMDGSIVGSGPIQGCGVSSAILLTPVNAIEADVTGDCRVDSADLFQLVKCWGTPGGSCDLNADAVVDGKDMGLLLGQWTN